MTNPITPFPKDAPAIPARPGMENILKNAVTDVEAAEERLRRAEAALSVARTESGARYVCRCCGQQSIAPFGWADHNQCSLCFNGIHGRAGCTLTGADGKQVPIVGGGK